MVLWDSGSGNFLEAKSDLRSCDCPQARGDAHRDVCIIPASAHGTNPASAAMCGMRIVTVGTDKHGNVDIAELRKAAEKHKDNLSALMVSVNRCWWEETELDSGFRLDRGMECVDKTSSIRAAGKVVVCVFALGRSDWVSRTVSVAWTMLGARGGEKSALLARWGGRLACC